MILLAERQSSCGPIKIFQTKRTGSFLYCQGGVYQSEADRRGVSVASYIHAFYGLLQQGRSEDVLMIGCGGGTLATMLAKARRRVTVLDVNPDAIFLARRYFGMPENVMCHVGDGLEFLASNFRTYDAIVLDAFEGDRIPLHLKSLAFFRLVRSRLSKHGCVLANLHVQDDLDLAARDVCEQMAQLWPDVRLLDRTNYIDRNAIAIAGAVSSLTAPQLLVRPEIGALEIERELASMRLRPWRDQTDRTASVSISGAARPHRSSC